MALTNCTPLKLWTPRARLASVCSTPEPSLTAADAYVLWGAELGQTIVIPPYDDQSISYTDSLAVIADTNTNVFGGEYPVQKMHVSSSGGLGLFTRWATLCYGDVSPNKTNSYPLAVGAWSGTFEQQELTVSWIGPRGPLSTTEGLEWFMFTKTLIGDYSLFLITAFSENIDETLLMLSQVAVRLQPGRVDLVCTSMEGTTTLRRHVVTRTRVGETCDATYAETSVDVLGQAAEGATTAVTLTFP